MARSKTSNSSRHRDLSYPRSLAALVTVPVRPSPLLVFTPRPVEVRQYGDRRLWQPDRALRPPHAMRPGASRVVASSTTPWGLRFSQPDLVSICARRKIRREVLHALKRTRQGAGARKRLNFWSKIKC